LNSLPNAKTLVSAGAVPPCVLYRSIMHTDMRRITTFRSTYRIRRWFYKFI